MDDPVISLQRAEIREKQQYIQESKTSISESMVVNLQFGRESATNASSGTAVASLEMLNLELDTVSKKLAALIEATHTFIENTIETFEQADKT